MSDNPYAAPSANLSVLARHVEIADIHVREAHLKHETQLRSVGLLYFLGAFILLVMAIPFFFALPEASSPAADDLTMSVFFILLPLVAGAVFCAVGYGFRTLRPWVRIPGTAFGLVGLMQFPLGTLINAYVLYLMYCPKGRTVLSPDYARVRAATPHHHLCVAAGLLRSTLTCESKPPAAPQAPPNSPS